MQASTDAALAIPPTPQGAAGQLPPFLEDANINMSTGNHPLITEKAFLITKMRSTLASRASER